MNSVAAYLSNGVSIYWSALTITLGILCCLVTTLALYRARHEDSAAVWALFCLGFVLAVGLGRLLHWYFNSELYGSFAAAFMDFNLGSFCIPGVLLGIWIAAWVVCKLGLCTDTGKLLDCAAPGVALLLAFIRLSALFNDTCRSKITVTQKVLQRLPFAAASTDAMGNVTWRLATFFIEFAILIGLFLMILGIYLSRGRRRMKAPCDRYGHVARLFAVYYGAIEIVADSTRYDSPLMHFHFISYLNQYSAFISLAQVFAAAVALGVLIYYTGKSVKANGFKFYHLLLWIGFLGSLVGIGYLGEYQVQRTARYLQCYGIMSACCLLMALTIYWAYLSCVGRNREA